MNNRLQNISQLLPTIPECKKLHDAINSQHPAEVFCNLANKYFPDLPKRLTCFITCLTFHDSTLVLTEKMKKVIDACNEVTLLLLSLLLLLLLLLLMMTYFYYQIFIRLLVVIN